MLKNNNSSIIDKIDQKLIDLQKNKNHSKYWNITWRLGVFLSELVNMNSPQNVLEIGTSNGFSTLFIAKSISIDSKIYTIEIDEGRFEEARKNFSDCGIENIISLNGNVFDILENYSFDEKIDFVFLDAAHKSYKQVINMLEDKNILSNNAIIVADNVISHSYMSEFIEYMKEKYLCQVVDMDSGFLVAFRQK